MPLLIFTTLRTPGSAFALSALKLCNLAAEYRTTHDARNQHSRALHIHTEAGRAIHLFGNIETRQRLARILKSFGLFSETVLGTGTVAALSTSAP